MLKPSLYALYKQGRFRRTDLQETAEGMKQVERFAVAMLAFVFQHNPEFRGDFLRQICDEHRERDAEEWLVELEVAGCGDLVLRRKDDAQAYVFEFKVAAPKQLRNQDPANPEFFITGYGAGIENRWPGNGVYILVQNEAEHIKRAQPAPECRTKSWRDISKIEYAGRPLIRDLFESLGRLEIPAFIHMNTQNISLGYGDSTLAAVKLYKLLHAVAGVIGSKSKALGVDLTDDRTEGYVGLNFVPTENKQEWHELVQPTNDVVGWFGYSQDKTSKRSTLDVWFYCGTPKATANVRSLLPGQFRPQVLPPEVKSRPAERNYVWISLPAEDSADNQDWFISVFDSVIKRK